MSTGIGSLIPVDVLILIQKKKSSYDDFVDGPEFGDFGKWNTEARGPKALGANNTVRIGSL